MIYNTQNNGRLLESQPPKARLFNNLRKYINKYDYHNSGWLRVHGGFTRGLPWGSVTCPNVFVYLDTYRIKLAGFNILTPCKR